MKKRLKIRFEKGFMYYSRDAERSFFFWGTVAMMIVWVLSKFLG